MADGDSAYQLPLEPSLKLRNHSPTGFEWGYGGSGPAQLALALLLDHLSTSAPNPECASGTTMVAERCYQSFKQEVIATLDAEWTLTSTEIQHWIDSFYAHLNAQTIHAFPRGRWS